MVLEGKLMTKVVRIQWKLHARNAAQGNHPSCQAILALIVRWENTKIKQENPRANFAPKGTTKTKQGRYLAQIVEKATERKRQEVRGKQVATARATSAKMVNTVPATLLPAAQSVEQEKRDLGVVVGMGVGIQNQTLARTVSKDNTRVSKEKTFATLAKPVSTKTK